MRSSDLKRLLVVSHLIDKATDSWKSDANRAAVLYVQSFPYQYVKEKSK